MRRKSAYILLMTAAERKLSQWSCRGAPSLWSLTPHFTDEGDLDRENGLKTGEKGAEISWLVSCKARPGAHCPDGGPRALSSEGGLVGSEQGGAGGNSAGRSPFSLVPLVHVCSVGGTWLDSNSGCFWRAGSAAERRGKVHCHPPIALSHRVDWCEGRNKEHGWK